MKFWGKKVIYFSKSYDMDYPFRGKQNKTNKLGKRKTNMEVTKTKMIWLKWGKIPKKKINSTWHFMKNKVRQV